MITLPLRCAAAIAVLLTILSGSIPPAVADTITFDFRHISRGGNVGKDFDGETAATSTVDGLTISGAVTEPTTDRRRRFNFTNGSRDLGIGVRSDAGGRATQIDIGEQVQFTFDQTVAIDALALQAFFLTADDGQGGPVAHHNDALDITLGGVTVNVASPYAYSHGGPTTYTIDLSSAGFAATTLQPGETLTLAPTAGNGLRLRSITVQPVPEPANVALLAVTGAIVLVRRRPAWQRRAV